MRCRILGFDLDDSDEGEHSVAAVVGLQSLVVTEILALVAYALAKHDTRSIPWVAGTLYLLLSSIPLAGLFVMMRAKMNNAHAYDRPTMRQARWSFCMSICAVTIVSLLCFTRLLPGQEKAQEFLTITTVEPYEWKETSDKLGIKKGDMGAALCIVISEQAIKEEWYPDPLFIAIELDTAIEEGWTVENVIGFEGARVQAKMHETETQPVLWPVEKERPNFHQIYWSNLKSGRKYTLKILLHSTKMDPEKQAKLVTLGKESVGRIGTIYTYVSHGEK